MSAVVTCLPVHAVTPQKLSEIRTVAQDSGDGVTSAVALVGSDDSRRRLGKTNQDGVLRLQQAESCGAGMVLEAKPGSAWYKKTNKDVDCASPEIVKLEPVNFATTNRETDNLLRNIDYVAAIEDEALMALLYNDLTGQVAPMDKSLSREYAERTVSAFARATDFKGDPVGPVGGSVLTPEFFAHVAQHQQSVGLEPTGRVDYPTLAAEANHDVGWFRHDVYQQPDTVPTRDEPVQCVRLTSSDVSVEKESLLVAALVRAAEERESAAEYGNAALLFNEAHGHITEDTMTATYTEQRVYENAGRVLNVPAPVSCDPLQRRFVMTPTMVEVIKAHQEEKPMAEEPGILGYSTLRSLAGIDVGPFLAEKEN